MARLPRAAWLAIGAIAAALLIDATRWGQPVGVALAFASGSATLVAATMLARRRRAAAAVLGLAFGSVALRAGMAVLLAGSASASLPPTDSTDWLASVADVSAPAGMEQRAFVELSAGATSQRRWLVYAWLPRHPALSRGDVIAMRGDFEPPPEEQGGFADFLTARGAVGTLRAHDVRILARGSGVMAAIEQLRWNIDASLSRVIPEPEAGLAAGILVGLRERVSRDVSDAFTATGLTHVVAISGWNIALVAGIATSLLRAVGLGRRSRSYLVMVAIAGYTLLAGAEASVVRAAVMGGVVLVAREGGHPAGAAAALGLACWSLLLVEPSMISDIGLQLSMAATAGLLALGAPSERLVERLTRGRAPRWFSETLGVSLAAQLATLPLILVHFGRLSLISPLANLVIAPVVPLAMLGAAVAVVVGLASAPLPGLLLALISLPAWLPLAAMTRIGDLFAAVPFASVALPTPFGLGGALLALGALVAALRRAHAPGSDTSAGLLGQDPPAASTKGPRPRHRRVVALGVAGSFIAVGCVVVVAQPTPPLRLTVLDIGQGDAILIESTAGGRVLVDGGPDPDLLVRRLDERIPIWDRYIDLVVLTHPHEDHAGGLGGLMPRYRVGRIAETGMASDGAGTRALRDIATRLGISRVRLTQGDAFTLGMARVEVVWPPSGSLPAVATSTGRAINDTSIVLAISLGRQRVLLTGDLEADRDADLLAALDTDGRAWDLLKVAHHGSAGATSAALLERLRPRTAVISAGEGNDYGHPAPTTLARLESVGARIWRTDRQGTFSAAFDGGPQTAAARSSVAPASPCFSSVGRRPPLPAGARDPCYARVDGGAHPSRGALLAHVHGSVSTPRAASHGRGRGGRLPGRPGRPRRPGSRPPPRRDGRAPPRHRQGAAHGPPLARAWARPSRRRVAQPGRSRRAGARRGGTSGHGP